MLERETEHILSVVQQRTIGAAYGITVKEILASDIPYTIKSLIRTYIELMLTDELQRHRSDSRFDFAQPGIQSLQQQINSALVLNYSFPRDEYIKRLDNTIHLLINYLIRPQWTLTSVLFEDQDRISTRAITRFLRYLAPYEYLKDIITRYVYEKRIKEFGKSEFSQFVWKADSEFIKRKNGQELANVMSALYDFFGFDTSPATYRVPINALVKFFEDKGLIAALTRLEGERLQSHEALTMDELTTLLVDVHSTSGIFEVQQLDGEPDAPKAESVEPPLQPMKVELPSEPQQQPFLHFNFLASISENDSKKFIRKIFKQDEEAYQAALQSMNKITSWKQASKTIDEIFIENDVDPYCAEAEKFMEIIFKQFHPKK